MQDYKSEIFREYMRQRETDSIALEDANQEVENQKSPFRDG
jgi:hypothetical protein